MDDPTTASPQTRNPTASAAPVSVRAGDGTNGDGTDGASSSPRDSAGIPAGATANQPPVPLSPSAGWGDARGLAEGGLLADVGILLDLASIYLPLASPILSPAVPTPFAVLMLRRGPRATLLAAAVATFLVSILAGPHFGWRMGLQALIGMLLGWAMRRRLRALTVLGAGTVLVTSVTVVAALAVLVFTGLPFKDVVRELHNAMESAAGLVAWAAGLLGQRGLWLGVRPTLAAAGTWALRFWPALFYLYTALFALPTVALIYAIANGTARVLGHPVRPFPARRSLGALRVAGFIVLAPVLLPALLWVLLRGARPRRPGRRAAGVRPGEPADEPAAEEVREV